MRKTFRDTLARQGDIHPKNEPAAGSSAPVPRQKIDVLIADGDKAALRDLKAGLEAAGLICEATADPWIALSLMASQARPCVLVAGTGMPELNGLELVAKLVCTNACASTGVVFISGRPKVDDLVQAIRLGARDFLVKPVDLRRLIQIVKDIRIERLSLEAGLKRVE